MTPTLTSVAVVRVRFIRSVNNLALATKGLTATPTINPPRLTVPGQHGFIDLTPIKSVLGADGVAYLDLVATDDAEVNETFGWVITGDGWTGFTRTVAVPQTGAAVETITLTDATTMPAVWLNALADFTGSSGSTGPDTATRTYVDDALDAHEAAPDPHPQYAMDSDVGGGGGAGTPDATTSTKGKAVLLGGTADAPTVPWTSVTSKPTIPAAYTDLTGTVPQAALPAVALTDFLGAVANQAAMLALTGQKGDWATRTDLGTDWQIIGATPTQLASWREHVYPASPVQSVNGRTGAVTGLAEQTALTAHTGATTNPHAVTKTQVGLGNVDNTADTAKPVSTPQQTALDGKAAIPALGTTIGTSSVDGSGNLVVEFASSPWWRRPDGSAYQGAQQDGADTQAILAADQAGAVFVIVPGSTTISVLDRVEDLETFAATPTVVGNHDDSKHTDGPNIKLGQVARSFVRSTRWHAPVSGVPASVQIANGDMRASRIVIPATTVIDRLALEVVTVGTAGSVVRLGVYADDGNGYPGALLLDAGTIDGTVLGTTTPSEIITSLSLTKSGYWITAVPQGTPTTNPFIRCSASPSVQQMPVESAIAASSQSRYSYWTTGVTGALPNPWPTTMATAGNAPRVVFRAQ